MTSQPQFCTQSKCLARIKRRPFYPIFLALVAALTVRGQEFFFGNRDFPTRLGSPDGPLAGAGIWAQMLAGTTPESLILIGIPVEHVNGYAAGGLVTAPHLQCNSSGYIQMVAWDGRLWGSDFSNVSPTYVGRTDTVRQFFSCFPSPVYYPQFTQSAIVPVPEPSTMLLIAGVGISISLLPRFHSAKRVGTRIVNGQPMARGSVD